MEQRWSTYREWSWLLLLVPIYLFIFLKLDSFHVRLWDESYFAVHATEMLLNDSWLIPYFEGEPVNGGTKPPLQSWLQIISMKVLGINELALRLPSAIAAALTVLVVFHYCRRRFNERTAWISSMVLLTTGGFIHFHTGRGMEADALLALTMLLQVVTFSSYLRSRSSKHILLFGLTVAIAFFTKSIAGFLFLPGFAMYLLLYERPLIFQMLRSWSFYAAIAIGFGLPIAFLLFRELMHPGFMGFIMERHVGRFGEELGYYTSRLYYLKILTSQNYILWSVPALAGIYFALVNRSENAKEARLVAIVALTFFVILNVASTKYEHYLNPVFPLFAILVGFLGMQLLSSLDRKKVIGLLAVAFLLPCYGMFNKSQSNYIDSGQAQDEMSAKYLHRAIKQNKDLSGTKVMHEGFNAALLFYKHKLADRGQEITLTNWDIEPGDKVLTCTMNFHRSIQREFTVDTIDQIDNAIVYHIKARRNE